MDTTPSQEKDRGEKLKPAVKNQERSLRGRGDGWHLLVVEWCAGEASCVVVFKKSRLCELRVCAYKEKASHDLNNSRRPIV